MQAKTNREKYTGVSSDDWRSGGGAKKAGFGSSSALGSSALGSSLDKSSGYGSSRMDDEFSSKLKVGAPAMGVSLPVLGTSCATACLCCCQ